MGLIKCVNSGCRDYDAGEPDNCCLPFHEILKCQKAVVRNVDPPKNDYVRILQSNECACDRGKQSGKAFCFRCFKALPGDMQRALYKRVGQGFEEAYEEAVKWLTENVW